MEVRQTGSNTYELSFDNEEFRFLENEAEITGLTEVEMFEMILGMLFIGGYSNIVGKEL